MACQRTTKTPPPMMPDPAHAPAGKSITLGQPQAPGCGRLYLLLSLASLLLLAMFFLSFGFWFLGVQPWNSDTLGAAESSGSSEGEDERRRYLLYWGPGIDCPGKHCAQCGGLGHQESSLRCALEEALLLNRTFVLPSRMCIADEHSDVGMLRRPQQRTPQPGGGLETQQQGCPMDALYDLDLMSHTVPVILSSSSDWQEALQRDTDHVHVEGIMRDELLKPGSSFRHARIINRTANRLAWFVECKNRHNRSAVMLPYSFLPSVAAPQLRAAAEHIKVQLGDYDALHVRRGDKVKVRRDRSGALRTMYARLDHDTQPDAILKRIEPWIPEGRTLFIATDEKQPHYFDLLTSKYKIIRADNFSAFLDSVARNNYQLFMVERSVLLGARTLVKTWKEDAGDLSLSDEAKKSIRRRWEPVAVHIT